MADTTLKNKKTGQVLFPETRARIVKTNDGETVESKIQTLTQKINAFEDKDHYKGYHSSESVLLSTYPNGKEYKEERKGWYARVGGPEGDDSNIYYWDRESSSWIKGAQVVSSGGASTVNWKEADENGNITLNASDIPTTFTQNGQTKSIQNVLNDLKTEIENGGGGGETLITDTLTLSKDVFVPEVPAKKGVVITGKAEPDSINENYPNFGFRLAEDGWYESLNSFQQGTNTFSLCKIYFNVEEETNVIFDVYNNGEQSYDFGYLSKLDTELDPSPEYQNSDANSDNIYYDFYSSGDMQTEVVYENVPVGEHFISVKYVKDSGGDAGIDKIRFKLSDKSKGSEAIPGYTYVSSNSIKIGDHNNLQIEDKDILKVGDTIKKLVGTEDNPIKFCDLEAGLYIIKGNIVWDKNKKKKGRVFSRIYDYGDVDAECLIQISKNTEQKYLITTYSAQLENYDLILTDYEILSGSIISRFEYEYEYDQLHCVIYDLQQYAHQSTLDYQVNTLNNRIDNVKIINSVSNPLEKTTLNDVDKFFVSTDTSKNDLYYTKITNIEETKTQLQPETQKVYNATIDKRIVNQTLSTTETSTVTLFSFDILTEEYGTDMNWQWINAEISEGKIRRLTLPWSGRNFYTEEDGWSTLGNNNDDNYFNVTSFINEVYYHDKKIYLNVHNIENWYLSNVTDFLFDVTKEYTITPLKVGGGTTITDTLTLSKEVYSKAVSGTVTYENVGTNNFILDEEGYYVNENPDGSSRRVSLMKITFNLNEPADIQFISSSYRTSTNITIESQFGDIDKELGENSYNGDPIYSDVSLLEDKVTTYRNFPAGEHFIIVRMVRGYNTGEGVFKFKLLTQIPSDSTLLGTVSNTISLNNEGNVITNDGIVLTDNDIKFVVGTEETPVSFQDLEVGKYKVKGYIKYFRQQSALTKIRNDAVLDVTVNIYEGSGTDKYIDIFGAVMAYNASYNISYSSANVSLGILTQYPERYDLCASNCHISYKYYSPEQTSTSFTLNYYAPTSLFVGGLSQSITRDKVLTTNNVTEYKPTTDYHPTTKKYVDDLVENNTPITSYDVFPETGNPNKFLNYTDFDNNELFFSKTVGTKNVLSPISWGETTKNHIIILKSLLTSGILTENTTKTLVELKTSFIASGTTYKQNTNIMASLKSIYMSTSFNTPVYTIENGWADDGLNDDEIFDYTQFLINNKEVLFSNYTNTSSWKFEETNIAYLHGDQTAYLKQLVVEPIVSNIRLALYEDLANAGGGSSSECVPITRKINGKTLDADINLTAEDLGISFEGEPTIQANDGILTIQKNGTQIGQFSANQSDSSTINIEVPTTTSQLTNNSGFLTSSSSAITSLGTRIDNLENAIPYLVVNELPATGAPKTMYLLNSRNENGDGYDEYLWVNEKWEQVGKNKVNSVNGKTGTVTITGDDIGIHLVFEDTLETYDISVTEFAHTIFSAMFDFGETVDTVHSTKINGKELGGEINLTASDVGALPSSTKIPTKVSDLTNDSQFTSETTVNNKLASYVKTSTTINGYPLSEPVVLKATDVGALTSSSKTITDIVTRLNDLESNVTFIRVSELPASGANNAIYLLNMRSDSNTIKDGYDEYVWISDDGNPHWEKIGSNYATKGSLGTQVTYTLSGTTLTITPK